MNESLQRSVYETVLDVAPPSGVMMDLRDAFEAITRQEWPDSDFAREEARLKQLHFESAIHRTRDPETISLTDRERILSRFTLTSAYFDRRDEVQHTLYDWPMFDLILYGKGQRLAGGNALMLGSQESVESLAFIALSREVYGADQAFIVDEVSGDDKRKHGNFAIGSAQQIPHEDGSMDLVHVNHVMDRANVVLDFSARTEYLQGMMTEAARVLKPGGQLLMVEKIPSSSGVTVDHRNFSTAYDSVKESIYRSWESAGFGQGGMTQAQQPMSLSWLFDPGRNYLRNGLAICADSFMLHATKR